MNWHLKAGHTGRHLAPVLQARLNYDASRFRAALRTMFKQTDVEVLKWQHFMMQKKTVHMIRCPVIQSDHFYL